MIISDVIMGVVSFVCVLMAIVVGTLVAAPIEATVPTMNVTMVDIAVIQPTLLELLVLSLIIGVMFLYLYLTEDGVLKL
jgi:hypothetical protein